TGQWTSMETGGPAIPKQETRERWALLRKLDHLLEIPMLVLGIVWLVLLVIELTRGLKPSLHLAGMLIWAAFIVDFGIDLIIAPKKLRFLRANWLMGLS